MPDWVLAAERAYVTAAVGRSAEAPAVRADSATQPSNVQADMAPAATQPPNVQADAAATATQTADRQARGIAAAGAVASRYLAVGTPRSFSIVIDDATDVAAAVLSLTAHRTWFDPHDIRCAATTTGAAELAAVTGGRVVSVDEALACDIVNVYSTHVRIAPTQLRRGTHVNAVSADLFAPELLTLATVVHEAGLPALAAGLVDGRQLDELTIFAIDGATIAAPVATHRR